MQGILAVVINLLIIAGCLFAIYKFINKALFGDTPQSPAAMGRAFASITIILIMALFISYLIHLSLTNGLLLVFSFEGFDVYLYLGFIASLIAPVLAGFIASRTSENTQTMNIKIIVVVGLFPYFIITSFAFLHRPWWVNYTVMSLYIPAVIIGFYLHKRTSNKAVKSLSQSEAA